MKNMRTCLATLSLFAASITAASATTPLPVRELGPGELGPLSGMPYNTPSNSTFEMAASVRAFAYAKGLAVVSTQRKTSAAAAVYNSRPVHAAQTMPPNPSGGALMDYITTGDLSQTWATMTADGIPYIRATGHGAFDADATASWNTTVMVPSGGSRELVVRVVVPPASVAGYTEQQGIARWRAKLRAELMVNGFPAWSSESMRLTIDPKVVNMNLSEKLVLQQFGAELTFPQNDEDASSANDTGPGNISSASTKRVVHLTLGRFNPGTVVDLSMVYRGTALSVPAAAGGTDNRCKYDNALARYYCSRGSVSVDGGTGEAPRIYMLP